MKKRILFFSIALLPLVALSNEPSAFGGGNGQSTSSSTYKITTSDRVTPPTSERVINQKNVDIPKVQSSNDTSEEYEGVRSVVDGYGSKISRMDERIRSLEKSNDELKNEVQQLKKYVEESRKLQQENQEKVKVVLGELSTLIDSVNKNYVSKDKFEQLAAEVRGGKPAPKGTAANTTASTATDTAKKEPTKEKVPTAKELSSKDSATLIKDADALYEKKSYNEAKILYDELLHRNYKPAKINFNLGEMAFSQKSYSTAIEHYKASIAAFDKAAYTPTLLYHTGLSFEKLGKTKEAQGFYKALKDGYPDSPEAKKVK